MTILQMRAESVKVDEEWVLLIMEAKELGLSKEEVLAFLRGKG